MEKREVQIGIRSTSRASRGNVLGGRPRYAALRAGQPPSCPLFKVGGGNKLTVSGVPRSAGSGGGTCPTQRPKTTLREGGVGVVAGGGQDLPRPPQGSPAPPKTTQDPPLGLDVGVGKGVCVCVGGLWVWGVGMGVSHREHGARA